MLVCLYVDTNDGFCRICLKSSEWNFDGSESSSYRTQQLSSRRHMEQVVYLLQALLGHCQVSINQSGFAYVAELLQG